MKNIFICLTFLTVILSNFSALSSDGYSYGEFKDGDTTYIFGDKVNLRETPSTSGKIIDTAQMGDEVKVVSKSEEVLQINGLEDNWYKVFISGKTAYVWGGTLSKIVLKGDFNQNKQEELLLVGIVGTGKDKTDRLLELRLIEDRKLISKVSLPTIETPDGPKFTYSLNLSQLDNKGFKPAPRIFSAHFEYGACDYIGGDAVVFLSDNKLTYAFSTMQAGNEIGSTTSDLILPSSNGGKANQISVITTETEMQEKLNLKTKTTEYVVKSKKVTKKVYFWNGKELKLAKN
jgi:uncharacterized protein YgiM (DUF1202 family)